MGLDLAEILPFPDWDKPTLLRAIEDRIDSALSSSNHILSFVLAPVRDFVHNVLHPIFAFADGLIGYAWDGIQWVFEKLRELIWNTIHAVLYVYDEAVAAAGRLASDALDLAERAAHAVELGAQAALDAAIAVLRRGIEDVATYVGALIGNLRQWAQDAIDAASGFLAQRVDDVESFVGHAFDDVKGWISDAVDLSETAMHELVNDVGDFLSAAITDAEHLAERGIDDLRQWASDAIDVLVRDVIRPIEHKLEDFLATEWAWAFDLLHLLEDAATWIEWVGTHVVGAAVDGYRLIKSLGAFDVDNVVGIGHDLAGSLVA